MPLFVEKFALALEGSLLQAVEELDVDLPPGEEIIDLVWDDVQHSILALCTSAVAATKTQLKVLSAALREENGKLFCESWQEVGTVAVSGDAATPQLFALRNELIVNSGKTLYKLVGEGESKAVIEESPEHIVCNQLSQTRLAIVQRGDSGSALSLFEEVEENRVEEVVPASVAAPDSSVQSGGSTATTNV